MIRITLVVVALWSAAAEDRTWKPPLHDPAFLNIGFVCRWQSHCIRHQQRAMKSSLKHVEKYRPAAWKVQVCNLNSSRNGTRKDWIGFNNCIRNPAVRPAIEVRRSRRR